MQQPSPSKTTSQVPSVFDCRQFEGLQSLELRARRLVEGFMAGMHRSPHQGRSVEFAEHREYVPGDDLRYIDWKVFGRTDRFYIKQYEEETNFSCYLLVDVSESMQYRSTDTVLTKFEYASMLTAALAWLILRQRDAVGLAMFDNALRELRLATSVPTVFPELCQSLESVSLTGVSDTANSWQEFGRRVPRRGLVLIFSDLFDEEERIADGLRRLRYERHDVSVIQLVDPAEQDFSFHGETVFRGLEGLTDIESNADAVRAAYRDEFTAAVARLGTMCRAFDADHRLVRTDESPVNVLRSLLHSRHQPAGAG